MAHVVFDFDGTIADSMWVVIDIYEQLFAVSVSDEQVEHIRGLNAAQVVKHLGVPLWKAPKFLTKGKKMMRGRMDEIKPFDGMYELIQNLHKAGHKLSIMSSNSEANVRYFLQKYALNQYFGDIIGGIGLFGKAAALRKFLAMDTKHVVYVGDETRDIDGAKKAHVPIIAVGWGYNNEPILRASRPDYFAYKPSDIQNIVGAL